MRSASLLGELRAEEKRWASIPSIYLECRQMRSAVSNSSHFACQLNGDGCWRSRIQLAIACPHRILEK